jgi:beta-1,4-mannosyl-glycoprotein beta-1,4-N-acetylglucosaminyltransferase
MKIYDAFTFYNELEILLVRLREHAPFVDHFVLVEGDHTHAGKPKAGVFDIDDPRFAEFRSKIIHVEAKLESNPDDPWVNERRQRDAILDGISPGDDDFLLVGDCDEIVSRLEWPTALERAESFGGVALRMLTAYYYVNLIAPIDWAETKLYRFKDLCSRHGGTNAARCGPAPTSYPKAFGRSRSCGWHLSYIGSESFIRNKLESFAHQEFNSEEYKDPQRIRASMDRRVDPTGRVHDLTAVPVTPSWPLEITTNPFWSQFTLPPDPFLRRLWNGGKVRSQLVYSAIAGRMSPRDGSADSR